ncbi:deoxyribonuclease gamma isoform X2 [Acipenser ruthenus]|uniref:deoxyribonuclease gamma isoform X2 n=1 Tax=Acipenser ruthenus TaxID=7906 RepID=UPI002741E339|nr:deoxyribonuclease gamma isoform X2 [Acipenser ruthenus]
MKPAALLSFVCLCNVGLSFKICAFNIQSFGETKAGNKQVMTTLVKIISRCDVCLIQEVRDSKGEAVPMLMKELSKDDVLRVRDQFQYPDSQQGDSEAFSREPFAVRFHSPHTAVKDFVLVAQHTCPKAAVREIDELYRVFQGVRGRWRTQNIMFLGDFNAACGYVTAKDWDAIRLRKNPDFSWLIGDGEDTTVSEKTHCAYDRIVVHGKEFLEGIVPNSARPFNFKKRFRLTEEEALEVSDHFPVEVDLKPSPRQPLHSEL